MLDCSQSLRSFTFMVLIFTAAAVNATAAEPKVAEPKVVKASHEQRAAVDAAEPGQLQGDLNTYSPQWPEPPNIGGMLLRLGIGTFVALGLCVGTLWLGKPWLQKLHPTGAGNPNFLIEATLSTGNRATLYLVRAGNIQLVAGADASGLKALIALPPSFKEVLDEQVPETDPVPREAPHEVAGTDRVATTRIDFDTSLVRPHINHSRLRTDLKE